MAIVPRVVGTFSPLRETLGFDARKLTPMLVLRVAVAAAETRSFKRAAIVIERVGGQTYLVMRGGTATHCRTSWVKLERRADGGFGLPTNGVTESCSGNPCSWCQLVTPGGCKCRDGGNHICNHTITSFTKYRPIIL